MRQIIFVMLGVRTLRSFAAKYFLNRLYKQTRKMHNLKKVHSRKISYLQKNSLFGYNYKMWIFFTIFISSIYIWNVRDYSGITHLPIEPYNGFWNFEQKGTPCIYNNK